ncbi:MAG: response regulator transcription factor [Chitinophagaceae bacterium]|nr:response regulator transcription factor [Chitinophagaceae bacterium]
MARILIADDHAIVRRGLKEILREGFPFAVVAEAENAEELIATAAKDKWDIIISDISMPGRSGLDALQQIRQHEPHIPVLILSIYPEEQYALRVLKAGAAGYLTKEAAPDELVNAVNKILSGKKYITPLVAEKLAESLEKKSGKASHETLSDREFDVMKLLASGKSVSEIASSLSLSSTTISTYRSRVLIKMNMVSNAELTRYALENRLI